jgi:hypothetical protein
MISGPLLIALIGYLIKNKHQYWLVSGYNVMSADDKKEVDIEKLSVFAGNMSFVIAGILCLGNLFAYLRLQTLSAALYFIMVFVVGYLLFKSHRFNKNAYDGSKLKVVYFLTSFLIIVLLATIVYVMVIKL